MYLTDGGNHYRLDQKVEGGWIVRQIESNETRTAPEHKLHEAIQAGELRESEPQASDQATEVVGQLFSGKPPLAASPAAMEIVKAKRRWIDALHAEGFSEISDNIWTRSAITRLAGSTLAGLGEPDCNAEGLIYQTSAFGRDGASSVL